MGASKIFMYAHHPAVHVCSPPPTPATTAAAAVVVAIRAFYFYVTSIENRRNRREKPVTSLALICWPMRFSSKYALPRIKIEAVFCSSSSDFCCFSYERAGASSAIHLFNSLGKFRPPFGMIHMNFRDGHSDALVCRAIGHESFDDFFFFLSLGFFITSVIYFILSLGLFQIYIYIRKKERKKTFPPFYFVLPAVPVWRVVFFSPANHSSPPSVYIPWRPN